MPTTTPKKIDATIQTFAKSINPGGALVYVNVSPSADAEPHECFNNVRRCVEKNGGREMLGWAIWSWPGVFIEAEHHSVWRKPDGSISDPTPTGQREARVLFLEDGAADYDHATNRRRDNIRAALRQDATIAAYLNASKEFHAYLEAHSIGKTIQAPRNELAALSWRNHRILVEIRRRYLGPNDLCTCGSGRKVKKCCGIEAAIHLIPQRGPCKQSN